MSVILLLVLLLHWMQSGSVIGGCEQRADRGDEEECFMVVGDHTGGQLGAQEEGIQAGGDYEGIETCPCTSYTSNMRTVVVKSTWCLALIFLIFFYILYFFSHD